MSPALERPRQAVVELCGAGAVGNAFARRLAATPHLLGTVRTRTATTRLRAQEPDLLVDATSPAYDGPAALAWAELLERTLRGGGAVATCNKAPLALAWDRLERAAKAGGGTLAASATVGGGTPLLATLRRLRAVHGVTRVEASLSGTLSFLLPRVAAGASLEAAVAEAQRAGLAEPDPGLDLDGTDATAKGVILHNALFDRPLRLDPDRPRLRLDPERIAACAQGGAAPVALARIAPGRVEVGLAAWDRAWPPGTAWVRAHHPDGTWTELAGPGAGPDATAAALVADLDWLLGARQGGIGPW
jgi:homoserine dehydrogenase